MTENRVENVSQVIDVGKFNTYTKKLVQISNDYEKKRKRYVFERPSLLRWVVSLSVVSLFSVILVFFLVIAIGTILYSTTYRIYSIYGIIAIFLLFIVNTMIVVRAISEIRFLRRYDGYRNILRYRLLVMVDDLAEMTNNERKVVEKDLKKSIKRRLIPQGHFGRDKVIFMVSDSVFETYSKRRAVFDRYFRKLTEERYRMMSHSKEIEEILEEGQDYLGKIRDCNDIIKDKVISQKLDRMERVVEAIFHEIDVNPSRARGSKLDVFLNYYLPTTEKLLEAYIDNSEKKVQSKSTEKMQIDITRALDTINVAFEGLLEWFYKKKERDIVGEIFAMEKITAQEGLQSNGIE